MECLRMTMNIHDGKFASKVSRSLFWRVLDAMSDSLADADFAECLAPVVNGRVCRDFGWDGVCEDANYIRTAVVWNPLPFCVKHVRLICGRNSPDYSFDIDNVHTEDPDKLGEMILGIWNARITDVRKKFATTRTVVLVKGDDLSTVSVFEEEALKFLPEEYEWEWNQRGNLEGYIKGSDAKKFTWQPHGSQFTVTTTVPENRLKLRIRHPPILDRDAVLSQIDFDPSWIEVVE